MPLVRSARSRRLRRGRREPSRTPKAAKSTRLAWSRTAKSRLDGIGVARTIEANPEPWKRRFGVRMVVDLSN